MTTEELDEVERRILSMLQSDARATATEIAEEVGVSDTTVLNRIERLEGDGVLSDYRAVVDYERGGFMRPFLLTCTASIAQRETMADRASDVPGVVSVTELMTGRENLLVRAVGEDPEDVTRIASELDELGLDVVDETAIRDEKHQSLDYRPRRQE